MFASWTGIQTDQFAFRVGNNDWSLASNFPLRRVPRSIGAVDYVSPVQLEDLPRSISP
jgi:hypothetical protein